MPNAQLEAEVIRDVLDQREQQLYLRHKAGKSITGLAAVYGRSYGGENGVREKLNELTERVRSRLSVTAAGGSAKAQLERLAQEHDDDDNSGGMPIKSVPAGTLGGRGAGGEAGPVEAPTPPIPPAPRPASSDSPSADPSSNGLHAAASSPAPASAGARGVDSRGRQERAYERVARERDERVLALLMTGARSGMAIAHELEISGAQASRCCERLAVAGKVRRTDHNAKDWPTRANVRPSRVWEAIDGPSFIVKPESEPPPEVKRTPKATLVGMAVEECEHGTPANVCFKCQKAAQPAPAPAAAEALVPELTARDRLVDLSRADALAVVLAIREGVMATFEGVIAVLEKPPSP